MSALFLRNLAEKTHRGLEGRVKAGKSAGGISYGYRMDRRPLPDGTYTTGDRVIDEAEAAIVRRIFTEYDRGRSARSIAIGLNRDKIPSPRAGGKGKGTWSFSTISGNWKRGIGILNNELYIGKLVWNRQRFVKDPDTGKRQARLNPSEVWMTEEVPHLQIIDDVLWQRVKQRQCTIRDDILTARKANADSTAPRSERGGRPIHLFSKLLFCGCCGKKYNLNGATHYGCTAARGDECSNRKTIKRQHVEARILIGLKDRLMHPELVRAFIAEYQRALRETETTDALARKTHDTRLGAVRREIENIVSAIAKGMFHDSMKARMDVLEAERKDLEARLDALPVPTPVTLHPGLADIYARKVADLTSAHDQDSTREEAAEILRGLVDKIILTPDPDAPNRHRMELKGELGAILSLCGNGMGGHAKARTGGAGVRQLTMVAGTRSHHSMSELKCTV